MAEVGPSSSFSSSPSFSVFIDTNLDTHLAILVSPDDTVADIKGKIRMEHALCFPDVGEISIKAMKVRRKASFYHLSDSMIVKSAFVGIKGTWFLHLDLAPTTIVNNQKEADKLISSGSGRQPKKCELLPVDRNSSPSVVNGETRYQDFVTNGAPMEKGLIHTSHDSQALQNVISPQSHNLHISLKRVDVSTILNDAQNDLNDNLIVSPSKLGKSSDLGVPEMEKLVAESNAVVGSFTLGADNVGISMGASEKEKAKKRGRILQNDQILDSKSQHPSPLTEKKRHKRENDGSLKDPVENKLTGDVYSKEMSPLGKILTDKSFQENHEYNLPIDDKHKKKKKRSKVDDESLKNIQVDKSIDKTSSSLEKQGSEGIHIEELAQNHAILGKESDAVEITDNSTQKETVWDLKQPNYTNEKLYEGTATASGLPIEEDSNVNLESQLHSESTVLNKEFNDATISKEIEQPTNDAEVVLEIPASSRRNKKKSKSEKDTSNKHDTPDSSVKLVNEEKNGEAYRNNCDKLSNASGVAIVDADLGSEHAAKVGPEIPSDFQMQSSHQTKKRKKEKPDLPNAHLTRETVNSSNQVAEENQGRTPAVVESQAPSSPSDKKPKRSRKKAKKTELPRQDHNDTFNSSRAEIIEKSPGKESKEAAVENSEAVESIVPSKSNDKKSKRKGKKSGKIELPHQETARDDSARLLVEETDKENPKENLEDRQIVAAQVAVGANLLEPKVPLSTNEKKSKHSRKKSKLGKTELPSQEASKEKSIDRREVATEEEPVESLITEKTGEDNTIGLEKSQEELGVETFIATVQEGSEDVTKAKDQSEQLKFEGEKIDFFKAFDPNANQIEPTRELHSGHSETKKTNMENSKRKKKLNASPLDVTANLLKPSVQDELHILKKKPQDSDSTRIHQKNASKSTDKSDIDKSTNLGSQSNDEKSEHLIGKKSMQSGSKLQSLAHNKGKDLKVSANDNSHDLAPSDDTTEEDTPIQRKRYRVAVRKVPSTRYKKVRNKSDEEMTSLAPSVSIFNDAESGSSEDKFEVKNRKDLMKDDADSLSPSSDSDKNIEEAEISTGLLKPQVYENSPGSESTVHQKGEKETNDVQSKFTQSSNTKRISLSVTLKNSNSYKKAKLSASQSEYDDSESQPVDVIPETQPEHISP